jgi:hypothetical protein
MRTPEARVAAVRIHSRRRRVVRDWESIVLEPPAGWDVDTVLAFVEEQGGSSGNIVVTHEPRRAGEPLRTHVIRRLIDYSRDVTDFTLVELAELTVAERPAVRAHITWMSERGVLEQIMVYVDGSEGRCVSFTCSMFAAFESARACTLAAFRQMLASVALAPRVSSEPPPPREPDLTLGNVPMPGTTAARRRGTTEGSKWK